MVSIVFLRASRGALVEDHIGTRCSESVQTSRRVSVYISHLNLAVNELDYLVLQCPPMNGSSLIKWTGPLLFPARYNQPIATTLFIGICSPKRSLPYDNLTSSIPHWNSIPDQSCVHRINGDTMTVLTMVEYKPPIWGLNFEHPSRANAID